MTGIEHALNPLALCGPIKERQRLHDIAREAIGEPEHYMLNHPI